ncbi:MAG: hypothetical protein AAF467_19350 [Actinomycetota bacterium]
MPLFGALDVAGALSGAPTMTSLTPDAWSLPGMELLQVSFEVAEEAALALTPPACHPSIPPYATFTVASFPTSPRGPFTLAMVRLIVRAGIRPRGLLLGSFTDNPAVAEELEANWGYRIRTADVSFSRRYELIRGSVTINGTPALDVGVRDPEPISGSDLELFDNLHLTHLADNDPVIVQVDPTYTHHRSDRGRPELATYDAALLGTIGLDPTYPVVGVATTADMELTAPRFLMDPETPAIKGTRRLDTV